MNDISEKDAVIKFLVNEPLIIMDSDSRAADLAAASVHGSIFIGIGIATDRVVSSGLPFDVLGMLLLAEKIRRRLAFDTIIVHVADEHAASNGLVADEVITVTAKRTKASLTGICQKLGLDCTEVLLSSEVDKTALRAELERKPIFRTLGGNQYLALELVDMEFFRRHRHATLKLSWVIPGTANDGHDERFFDSHFTPVWGEHLDVLHVAPGFTFDPITWRTSPYIHDASLSRILLEPCEDVRGKFAAAEVLTNDRSLHGARNHLKQVVRLFESLFGSLGDMPLEGKVQTIIDRLTT